MSNFRPVDRTTGFLLPPSVDERLSERHLPRVVMEVIDWLDQIGDGIQAILAAWAARSKASEIWWRWPGM